MYTSPLNYDSTAGRTAAVKNRHVIFLITDRIPNKTRPFFPIIIINFFKPVLGCRLIGKRKVRPSNLL